MILHSSPVAHEPTRTDRPLLARFREALAVLRATWPAAHAWPGLRIPVDLEASVNEVLRLAAPLGLLDDPEVVRAIKSPPGRARGARDPLQGRAEDERVQHSAPGATSAPSAPPWQGCST